jgi:ABC-type glycerol-3-phosphate transport system substrate-binding protein
MRKMLILYVIMALLGSGLAACQAAATPNEGEQPAATEEGEQPDQPAPAQDQVTLTLWDFGGEEVAWIDTYVIPVFKERYPYVTINHVGVPEEELGLKLETAIAAGEVPDIVIFPPPRVIAAGHVLALDDLMARDGLSRQDYCPIFNSNNLFAGGGIYNDKVYSLPVDNNIWAMLYNKTLFKEAGLPELKATDYIDFDTWLTYARAINKPAEKLEDRVWGSAMFSPSFNSMNNFMSDPYVLGKDGRSCTGSADTQDWIHFFEVLVTAYKEDLTTETAGAMLADIQEDMFLQGKLGMTYAALGDAYAARAAGLDVGLTGQPVVTKGWPGNVGGWNGAYNIMAASKHQEEAWQFIKFLSTEAPLIVPIGSDALAGGGGLPGLPCYQPLLKNEKIADMIANDPLIADYIELQKHYQAPPFSPDIWASVSPFDDAYIQMTEGGEDVASAVQRAAGECQAVLDDLWADFDALGK